MKIDFPKMVWDKVMTLSRQEKQSPIAIIFKAIDLYYTQQEGTVSNDSTQESNRTAPTMVK